MPPITEQIQTLIEQGNTEQALETLANWLRTEQSLALNEVILLRSRYEQVERELGLNLISAEEAARSYSQINFSLLNLVQNVKSGTPTPTIIAPAKKQNLLPFIIVGLSLLSLVLVFIFYGTSSRIAPSDATPVKEEGVIEFPQGNEVSLTTMGSTATYTILTSKAEPYNPENQKITLTIRCFLKGVYDMNFWSADFRLIANELPYAALGNLSKVVAGDSFKDGELYFLIPKDLRKGDLKINFYEEYTVLPLTW